MELNKLSIIVPVYNEINTILEVIKRIKKEKHKKEIIIVDDCSTDGTREVLKNISDPDIKVIFQEKNRGKGFAIRTAIPYCSGEITIIQDADLEYYPDEYSILIEKILEDKADVVYGTRFLGPRRVFYFYHYLGNLILNIITNFLLDSNLTDLMTCYKAFKTSVLKKLNLKANRFGIEVEITVEVFKRRLKVYEVPISYEGRSYEEGKKIRWTDFFTCLYWLFVSILRKPDIETETLYRVRILKNYNNFVFNLIKPYLGERLLELGSGIGNISKFLVSIKKEVILSDYNKEYLEILKNKFIYNPYVKILKIDLNDFSDFNKLKEENIDTVIAINVLEHIENDLRVLENLKNIIKNQGKLILLVPAHKILFSNFDKELGHFRRYSKKELVDKLNANGFYIENLKYINFLSAIGWFFVYKLLKRKHFSIVGLRILNLIIPIIILIEKYIKFGFGLSIFVVAKKNA